MKTREKVLRTRENSRRQVILPFPHLSYGFYFFFFVFVTLNTVFSFRYPLSPVSWSQIYLLRLETLVKAVSSCGSAFPQSPPSGSGVLW